MRDSSRLQQLIARGGMPDPEARIRGSIPAPSSGADVPSLPWRGSDERLLGLARVGATELGQVLHDRYADDIHRVVYRVLGPDSEHEDVVQQVFVEVLRGVHQVRDGERLAAWIRSVAVNVARGLIRRRRLRFWLEPNSDEADSWCEEPDDQGRELVRRTYAVLAELRTDDRIAFTLRFIEGYQVQEVAELTRASLATVHRRLARASKEFRRRAERDDLLCRRLQESEIEPEPEP